MKLFTPLTPSADAAEAVRAMALLGAAVFVVSLGYGAGLPLLQLFLVQYLGSAEPQRVAWHVGMLGGVYTFALFLFAPWWGRLFDRRGRTVVLMAGFAAFLVGSAVAALAPNLGIVYAARLLAGAGALCWHRWCSPRWRRSPWAPSKSGSASSAGRRSA